jgi:hypothetical protein
LTVAERLEQLQNLLHVTQQAYKSLEAELMHAVAAHELLAYHTQNLLRYALENNIATVAQLVSEQAENVALITKMTYVKIAACSAQKIFEKIIGLAGHNQLLNLYLSAEKKLHHLYQQDKFVPETALPIPTLQHSVLSIARRNF